MMQELKMRIQPIPVSTLLKGTGHRRYGIVYGGLVGMEGDWRSAVTLYEEETHLKRIHLQLKFGEERFVPEYQARSTDFCMTILRNGDAYILCMVGRQPLSITKAETRLRQLGLTEYEAYVDAATDDMWKLALAGLDSKN